MKTIKFDAYLIKTSARLKKSLFKAIILITAFGFSCNNNDDPSPASPDQTKPAQCKLKTESVSGTGRESATVTYTYQFMFNYTYDERGNQTGFTASHKYNYSDGKTTTSSSSTSYQYDANDFLIRTIAQYTSTAKDGKVSNSTSNVEYVYANGRLTSYVATYVDNGTTRNYTLSYEYNSDGKILKVTNSYDNTTTKYEWDGNKLLKMTQVDQYGKSNSPFLEYNNEGLLIKSIETSGGSSDEFRYQYDAEGQEVRFERYINAKPNYAYDQEYDKKENPYLQLYANAKGHPTLPGRQSHVRPKHNVIKSITYDGNAVDNTWTTSSTTVNTIDYNTYNLPVEIVAERLDQAGKTIGTSKTSYTYQDCQ